VNTPSNGTALITGASRGIGAVATLRDDPSITVLVNNAGTASIAPLLSADVDEMEDMIAINVTALAGLDQGEVVTLPSLQDGDEWTRFEGTIATHFGNSVPAPRYAATTVPS
jgi:short-subunit dehydrogenase